MWDADTGELVSRCDAYIPLNRYLDADAYGAAISALDAEIARREGHPFILARYGAPQQHRDSLVGFEKDLAGKAISVFAKDDDLTEALLAAIPDRIPLHRVARGMGGGLKSWGRIVDLLLDGSVRFAMSAFRTSRMWIGAEDAERMRSLPPATTASALLTARCSQRDALEILNLPIRKASLLGRLAAPNERWEMEGEAVLRLAEDRITLTEMCARTGMQSKTLLARLDPVGLRTDDFGWWRDEALPIISEFS